MSPTLLIHPSDATSSGAGADLLTPRPDGLTRAAHWSNASLPSRLNQEWARLCTSAEGRRAARTWATPGRSGPALTAFLDVDGLYGIVQLLQSHEVTADSRDAVLVGLLERAQDGDQLAGRVVLQTMLPAAVRIAQTITDRPDVLGDRDEAFALVLAALWQVVATYPVASRRVKVPANLYLDTLALVRRGHTSSTHRVLVFPEQPFADIGAAADPATLDPGYDDLYGPADAQLCTVLAWAVRSSVLRLDEARVLVRVYGLEEGPADAGPALADESGISWAALRQRCHRLARRVGHAAIEAGIECAVGQGAVLRAA